MKKHLTGPFETGATNSETNDFILTAENHRPAYDKILKGIDAANIYMTESSKIFDHIIFMNINLNEANESFTELRERNQNEKTK